RSAFRLNVDLVKAERVLADHPVNSLVTTLAKALDSVLAASSVAHGVEHVEHKVLKELRRLVEHAVEQFGRKRRTQLTVGVSDTLVRRRVLNYRHGGNAIDQRSRVLVVSRADKLVKLRELSKYREINPVGV